MFKPSYFVLSILLLSFSTPGHSYTVEPTVSGVSKLFDLNVSLPSDLVVGKDKKIYVVDGTNHRIAVFSHSGQELFTFGSSGKGDGMFMSPTGIGIDQDNNIYVCDSGNRRIQVFNERGGFLWSFPVPDGPVGPARPVDIVINKRTRLCYVTDSINHRVMVFELKGKQVYEWGGKGESNLEFRYPATLTMEDYLYVVDSLNSRVQVFEGGGLFVRTVGQWGVLPGELFRPKGVALDEDKKIYISDSYMDIIEVFDDKGFRHVLGDEKGKIRRFNTPLGIFIDGNRLYVAEFLGNKIGVYSLSK